MKGIFSLYLLYLYKFQDLWLEHKFCDEYIWDDLGTGFENTYFSVSIWVKYCSTHNDEVGQREWVERPVDQVRLMKRQLSKLFREGQRSVNVIGTSRRQTRIFKGKFQGTGMDRFMAIAIKLNIEVGQGLLTKI